MQNVTEIIIGIIRNNESVGFDIVMNQIMHKYVKKSKKNIKNKNKIKLESCIEHDATITIFDNATLTQPSMMLVGKI